MFSDLNGFIAELDRRRELARVTEAVDPYLEISAVVDQASKQPKGGPGLLFEQPTGYDMPVAVNLYGSDARMSLALGVDKLDDLSGEIRDLITPPMPKGFLDALKMLPLANRLKQVIAADAAIYHVVKQIIIASLHGHPQPLVIEAARSGIAHKNQPGFAEVFDGMRGK